MIPLEQALAHLRLGTTYPPEQVQPYLEAAMAHAQQHVGRMVYADAAAMAEGVLAGTAGDDPVIAGKDYIAAVLLILGHLFANREAVGPANLSKVPMGAYALLQPYRRMGV